MAELPDRLFRPDRPNGPLQDGDLLPYRLFFARRIARYREEYARIQAQYGSLRDYAGLHLELGMHKSLDKDGRPLWTLREWMPAATELWLTTDALNFGFDPRFAFRRVSSGGLWMLTLPAEFLPHGAYMELRVRSAALGDGPAAKRIPAFAVWVEQDARVEEQWCARVWDPPQPYRFRHVRPAGNDAGRGGTAFPRIYEAHVGLAQSSLPEEGRTAKSVGSFAGFTRRVLPYIRDCGYNAVQLMGIAEHPLYRSFGYQVTNYFAVSSRFGTPDEFRELVDSAHALDLGVILDIAHSHSAPNTEQGIARYDTSPYFFQDKDNQWGTLSFDYGREMTRRFLLSNCRYWMEEFRVDGFRFDAVGNMVYLDHGFGDDFSEARRCFYDAAGNRRLDDDGVLYLSLANALIHEIAPDGISVAEEFSGMPGITSKTEEGGLGFDYRFAMGVPDFWGKFIKEGRTIGAMWHELNNYRHYDKTVSYTACHDQCINGKDAMIWRLIGDDMYRFMSLSLDSWKASRGVALYKLMRLLTLACADKGWLNFMGDEFGHPEWIDAEDYGQRQWHLARRDDLKYAGLAAFDRALMRELAAARPMDFAVRPLFRFIHEERRILAFERGDLLFVFNFHETQTETSLELPVRPGKYVECLSSDDKAYAGHGNLSSQRAGTEHFSQPVDGQDMPRIWLYLPPLVALVLSREP